MSSNRYPGVTPPISEAGPKPDEIAITESLMEELKRRDQFETDAGAKKRLMVLGRLNALVKEFVQIVADKQGVGAATKKEAGGKIFTFGSYRLGVHGPGSDIDTLIVVPGFVQRNDFFTVFEDMLHQEAEVSEAHAVPEAYVPVIKMKFSGVDIDLLFASFPKHLTIPDDLQLGDDQILRGLDDVCLRSVSGSRVTDEILRLVPNKDVFRDSLRTIKLWAGKRAIYSNVMGFLGGVAWAMLTARICQLYPNQNAGGIISRLFLILLKWKWPQPVVLKPIEDGPLGVRVWNPKAYPSDRGHRMPIITPSYPSINSTHNVSYSTQTIMTEEFKRASDIVDRISVGHAQWAELFAPTEFFTTYKYYLQICASSTTADAQLKWQGTVESKIRQLVMKLETVDTILLAHPFVKNFEKTYHCLNDEECKALATGQVLPDVLKRTSEEVEGNPNLSVAYCTYWYIGLRIELKPKGAAGGPAKLDISYPATEFTKMVKNWEPYDPATMGISIRNVKNSALPAFVFPDGQPPPSQPKTLKRAKSQKKGDTASTLAPTGDGSNIDQPSKKSRIGTSDFIPEDSPSVPVAAPNPVPDQTMSGPDGAPFVPNGTTQTSESPISGVPGLGAS